MPAPVLPQMPTFSAAFTENVNPLSTLGSSSLYAMQQASNSIAPSAGHDGGGTISGASELTGSSGGSVAYWNSRSMLTICVSRVVDSRTAQLSVSLSPIE